MADRPRVAIATYTERRPLRRDDLPLSRALEAMGTAPVPIVWDDSAPDWKELDACLIRSVSDYHVKYEEFVPWVTSVGERVPLWNPAELMLWNSDKAYLRDLADAGIPTIPTEWLERTSNVRLADVLAAHDWPDAIIKPSIGLASQNLHRVSVDNGVRESQLTLERLLAEHDVLVQPFLPAVMERGETSLIYIDGALTHTVRKRPMAGDFRVQKPWGGTSEPCEPTAGELEIAQAVFDYLGEAPLYGRIDLLPDPAGEPCLIEIELIEPDLFFRHEPAAATALAEAIAARLT